MDFERKHIMIGLIIFAIVYSVLVFFALKTEYAVTIIIVFSILLMIGLMIAEAIERRIKGDPDKNKKDINFPYFVGLAAMLAAFLSCLLLTINSISFKINGVPTIATIYDINKKVEYKTYYDSDDNAYEKEEEHCSVYIKYEALGNEYDTKLDVSDCKMKKGQKVKIYYDKDDPSSYASDSSPILLFSTLFTGFILGVFLFMTYKDLFMKKKGKRKSKKKKKV